MRTKSFVIIIVIALVVGLVAGYYFGFYIGLERASQNQSVNQPLVQPTETDITSFEECAAAGNPVMESYPRQCRTVGGELFVENIGNELEKTDLVRLDDPRPNQVIVSPLTITGQARGTWYFEATFPVVLVDWDGLIIAEGYAQAQGDWMTEDFVPFTSTLEFTSSVEGPEAQEFFKRGSLILRKDNPSGLPENDGALEIPIRFAD